MKTSDSCTLVYRPAEDTFLLADAIESHEGEIALEIGVGSGYVAVELAKRTRLVIGTDVNIAAIREAHTRVERSGLGNAELICCDRGSSFRDRPFDLIVFNPPYLPLDAEDDIAVNGGRGGVAMTMKFLEHASALMRRSGCVLFVMSTLSDYRKILESLGAMGFRGRVLKTQRLFFERLMVVEAFFSD